MLQNMETLEKDRRTSKQDCTVALGSLRDTSLAAELLLGWARNLKTLSASRWPGKPMPG